jgi:hypothetical protein
MAMKGMQERNIVFKLIIFCWFIIGFYPLGKAHALELNIPESHAVSLIEGSIPHRHQHCAVPVIVFLSAQIVMRTRAKD